MSAPLGVPRGISGCPRLIGHCGSRKIAPYAVRDSHSSWAVVRPDAPLLAFEQAGLGEDPKVMTHGRLG